MLSLKLRSMLYVLLQYRSIQYVIWYQVVLLYDQSHDGIILASLAKIAMMHAQDTHTRTCAHPAGVHQTKVEDVSPA